MSIDKVRRYNTTGQVSPTGRYIEYADVAGLVEALKMLMRGYVNTLENARDRIISLGGKCDELLARWKS